MAKNSIEKTTLLLSGGPDSVTLAYYLIDKKITIEGITFLHNPRGTNVDEVGSATYFSKELNISHKIFDTSNLIELYGSNPKFKFSLGGAKDCIPNNLIQTPLSVHLMLFKAAMYSISKGIYSISWAIHQDDLIKITEKEIQKIIYLVSDLISDEIGEPFRIKTPFLKLHKQDILEIAKKLGVKLDRTISCFDSVDNVPCGKCIKCIERKNAMENKSRYLNEVWEKQ